MKKISLTGKNGKGKYSLVDNDIFDELKKYKWHLVSGYAARFEWIKEKKNVRPSYMHRTIMNTPNGKQTDHINLNKLDNRKENLRVCSRVENSGNIPLLKNNTSGFKGVGTRGKKWRAYISNKNKHIHLGYFSSKELAAEAYNSKAIEIFGEFALLNRI